MEAAGRFDAVLLRVAGGDRAALRELYGATSALLFGVCQRVLRDRSRAEDVLQDAYVRIWERARLFDPAKGSGVIWMVTLTRRLALNEVRRTQASGRLIDGDEAALDQVADDAGEIDPIGGRRLKACLDRLSEDQRRAVVMAYVLGYSHDDLARRLDRPLGTVKSWISRGLSELKRCMQ